MRKANIAPGDIALGDVIDIHVKDALVTDVNDMSIGVKVLNGHRKGSDLNRHHRFPITGISAYEFTKTTAIRAGQAWRANGITFFPKLTGSRRIFFESHTGNDGRWLDDDGERGFFDTYPDAELVYDPPED